MKTHVVVKHCGDIEKKNADRPNERPSDPLTYCLFFKENSAKIYEKKCTRARVLHAVVVVV